MKWLNLLLISTTIVVFSAYGQELNCEVIVNSERVAVQDQRIIEDMQNQFTQFMNDRKWTEINFEQREKINCRLAINLNEVSNPAAGTYSATVQIQSSRPVYNSSYETLLLNFADRDWSFAYQQSQPIEYSPNIFSNNITSLLSFYAYVIIGLDFDSFSERGGEQFLQEARDIVTTAQSAGAVGWSALDGNRNRYWLIESILNTQYDDARVGFYNYHRKGLDTFADAPDESRTQITTMVEALEKIHDIRPNNVFVTTFLDTKANEVINIFSQGDLNQRKKVFNILTEVDPSRRSEYENILQ